MQHHSNFAYHLKYCSEKKNNRADVSCLQNTVTLVGKMDKQHAYQQKLRICDKIAPGT